MSFLRALFRFAWRLAAGLTLSLVILVTAYVIFGKIAWRDIPVATLESKYGDPTLQTAVVDGVPLRYRVEGTPGATWLVLIHSHFMDMRMWDGWVEALGDQYRILRYDLSGHGLTGPDASGVYQVARDVALLEGLLQVEKIDRFHLVGSSLGGNIAFHYASGHSGRLLSLTLINSGGMPRKNNRASGTIPAVADHVFPLIPPMALKAFQRWMVAAPESLDPRDQQRFVDMFFREGNRKAELARLRQYEVTDPSGTLAEITAPTLVLWGADNPQLPAEVSEKFTAKLSQAARKRTVIMQPAGHLLPLEIPAESARVWRQFVQSQADEAITP